MYKDFRIALLVLVSLFAISANGSPLAYSVNSDSGDVDSEDSLYVIDLADGSGQRRGTLESGIIDDVRHDTEGLALSPLGVLWGIDDESRSLFPINVKSGTISLTDEIQLPDFPSGGGNDFGMTFSCDNTLYVSSVATRTLYEIEIEENEQGKNKANIKVIGSEGALGANISAIAAIGNPARLYGLGNGQFQDGETDSPNLYSIDAVSGVAKLVGPLGNEAGEYNQGGLAFDSKGKLWAITDRRIINNKIENLPSQILNINIKTGAATLVSDTGSIEGKPEVGFESLAIASPFTCATESRSIPLTEGIPTTGAIGRYLFIGLLMLVGFAAMRRRDTSNS